MTNKTLLPPNATQGELALELVMSHVGDQLFDVRDAKNADLCPVDLLPWLAWENAITWWDPTWTEEQKRGAIKSAPAVNKKRGTLGAVKQALAAVGYAVDVIEWFNETPPAEPHTFRIVVNGNVDTPTLAKIHNQVIDAKNCRSWLSSIDIRPQIVRGPFYVGGAIVATLTAEIGMKDA